MVHCNSIQKNSVTSYVLWNMKSPLGVLWNTRAHYGYNLAMSIWLEIERLQNWTKNMKPMETKYRSRIIESINKVICKRKKT